MENSKGSSNPRNFMCSGKHALLPPKSPFPFVSPSYADYVPSNVIGSKAVQKHAEGNMHHQRASSETFPIDEQPSWLDDLLNEPEMPVRRGGHRRSSSDSFAYIDVTDVSNIGFVAPDEYRYKNMMSIPSLGSQEFDHHKDTRQTSLYVEMNMIKQKNMASDSSLNAANCPSGLPSVRENAVLRSLGSSCGSQESDGFPSSVSKKQGQVESVPVPLDTKAASDKKDGSHAKSSASETDTKRAKQQFAQRSRVRKLQYIAELERSVQAMQVEGSEVSAELDFLNQQNLILSMENNALKQRLESLAQEHLIKYLEQEVLEREIGRLRALYQQQQQPSMSHRRSNSRDLDSQFANLSLKHKDTDSSSDPVSGPLHIWRYA
uniref:BZIP domain-containing protein n=1 Tax=Rhizophora mucronata TaxID=61149 RepID=A0A2P2L5A6_RHIMU